MRTHVISDNQFQELINNGGVTIKDGDQYIQIVRLKKWKMSQ